MTRHLVIALAIALALPACHKTTRACEPREGVVACVDGEPVTKLEIEQLARPPTWVDGSATQPDPRRVALDQAVRMHLFAEEAERRKLATPPGAPQNSPAVLAQALVQDEAKRRGISRDAVSDDEAKRYFEANKGAFSQIDEFRAQAIVVGDPKLAERVYAEAKGADEARFAELARKWSVDEASKEKGGDIGWVHATRDTDRELLALGLTLRRAGVVGGPVRGKDGRYWILRTTEVPFVRVPAVDEATIVKAKNLIAHERREAALAELDAQLRKNADVKVFDGELAKVAVPTR